MLKLYFNRSRNSKTNYKTREGGREEEGGGGRGGRGRIKGECDT